MDTTIDERTRKSMRHHVLSFLADHVPRHRRGRPALKRLALGALLGFLSLPLFQNPANAWGRLGHRAAAKLTESRLNASAKLAIAELLEPGESLADASTWADEQRRAMPESAPWHYVNVPLTEARYDRKFCPAEGCVIEKVEDFQKVLKDASRPRAERQKALRFLVHFVQDMHQPLHVGDRKDRGGNDLQVQFFAQGSNLHRVWDSGLIERQFTDEAALTAEISKLASVPSAVAWTSGTVDDWATESLALARRAYVEPADSSPLRRGSKLGPPYQEANLPPALERVSQAGVRLATILNAIFPVAP